MKKNNKIPGTVQLDSIITIGEIFVRIKDYLPNFNFLQKTIKPHQKICKILLNQKLFPGVGNYIKSETLYLTNIHPEQTWNLITIKKKKE